MPNTEGNVTNSVGSAESVAGSPPRQHLQWKSGWGVCGNATPLGSQVPQERSDRGRLAPLPIVERRG